jgi:hypothetical protein
VADSSTCLVVILANNEDDRRRIGTALRDAGLDPTEQLLSFSGAMIYRVNSADESFVRQCLDRIDALPAQWGVVPPTAVLSSTAREAGNDDIPLPTSSDQALVAMMTGMMFSKFGQSFFSSPPLFQSPTARPSRPIAMISSPTRGLEGHRLVAIEVCQKMRLTPLTMDHEPAAGRSPTAFSLDLVDGADFFILILGRRYGAAPAGSERSYTHLEFERAQEMEIPTIVLLTSPEHPWVDGEYDTGSDAAAKIEALRKLAASKVAARLFSSPVEMRAILTAELHALMIR